MLTIVKHPLIDIKLTKLRDEKSDHLVFRKNLNEIASLMTYEVFRNYVPKNKVVISPTGTKANGKAFDKEIVIVPILRAGLGMVEGIIRIVPQSRIGHIGIYRDEQTFKPIEYFFKMPQVDKNSQVLVVDPMLATGVSSIDAINQLKDKGFKNINLMCLVAAPNGVENVQKQHPNIDIFLAALDEKLDENKYIIPGLGDAGDRIFGTK